MSDTSKSARASEYAAQIRGGVVLSWENLARFVEEQDAEVAALHADLADVNEARAAWQTAAESAKDERERAEAVIAALRADRDALAETLREIGKYAAGHSADDRDLLAALHLIAEKADDALAAPSADAPVGTRLRTGGSVRGLAVPSADATAEATGWPEGGLPHGEHPHDYGYCPDNTIASGQDGETTGATA